MLCRKCGLERDGKKRCNNCKLMWQKIYNVQYKATHKEYYIEYAIINKEKIKIKSQQWYQENKEKVAEYNKINKKYKRKQQDVREKERKKTDPAYKLRKRVSSTIRYVLNGKKNGKSVLKYLSYTFEELKMHLENKFDENMSWKNYGSYWHLDHIYPQSLLPYDSMEHENFKKCWALENLQPLEAIANIKKGNKIIEVI